MNLQHSNNINGWMFERSTFKQQRQAGMAWAWTLETSSEVLKSAESAVQCSSWLSKKFPHTSLPANSDCNTPLHAMPLRQALHKPCILCSCLYSTDGAVPPHNTIVTRAIGAATGLVSVIDIHSLRLSSTTGVLRWRICDKMSHRAFTNQVS